MPEPDIHVDMEGVSRDAEALAKSVLVHGDQLAQNLVFLKTFLKSLQEREEENAKAQADAANALADKQLGACPSNGELLDESGLA